MTTAPRPRLQHVRPDRAHAEEAAVEVDREHLAPALGRQLDGRHARAEPGIVDEDVDPAVTPCDLLDHGRDARLVDDVEPMRLAAPDLGRDRLGRREIDVGHRDLRAGLRQRLSGRAPDAGAAAGHHRDPPVEPQQAKVVHHLPLPAKQPMSADRRIPAAASRRSSVTNSIPIRRASQR